MTLATSYFFVFKEFIFYLYENALDISHVRINLYQFNDTIDIPASENVFSIVTLYVLCHFSALMFMLFPKVLVSIRPTQLLTE